MVDFYLPYWIFFLKVRQIATDDLHLSYVDDNDDDYVKYTL